MKSSGWGKCSKHREQQKQRPEGGRVRQHIEEWRLLGQSLVSKGRGVLLWLEGAGCEVRQTHITVADSPHPGGMTLACYLHSLSQLFRVDVHEGKCEGSYNSRYKQGMRESYKITLRCLNEYS